MGWGLLGGSSSEWLCPQNDPDKEYNMPKDGTVHELTSNVGAAWARGWGQTPALNWPGTQDVLWE